MNNIKQINYKPAIQSTEQFSYCMQDPKNSTIQDRVSITKQTLSGNSIQSDKLDKQQLNSVRAQRRASRSYLDRSRKMRITSQTKESNGCKSNSRLNNPVSAFDQQDVAAASGGNSQGLLAGDSTGKLPHQEDVKKVGKQVPLSSRSTGLDFDKNNAAQVNQRLVGVLNSQTITKFQSQRLNSKERASRKDIGQKSRSKIRAILGENYNCNQIDPQTASNEQNNEPPAQKQSMGITFGGDEGFGNFSQKTESEKMNGNQESEHQVKQQQKSRRGRRYGNPHKNLELNDKYKHQPMNSKNELEIIYENEFYTQSKEDNIGRNGSNMKNIVCQKFQTEHAENQHYTKQPPQIEVKEESAGKFKQNMLLGFYDWPRIETSSVLTASLRNSIHSDNTKTTTGGSTIFVTQKSIKAAKLNGSNSNSQTVTQVDCPISQKDKANRGSLELGAKGEKQIESNMNLKDLVYHEVHDSKKAAFPRTHRNQGQKKAYYQPVNQSSSTSLAHKTTDHDNISKDGHRAQINKYLPSYTVPFLKELESMPITKTQSNNNHQTELSNKKDSGQKQKQSSNRISHQNTQSQHDLTEGGLELHPRSKVDINVPKQRYNSVETEHNDLVTQRFQQSFGDHGQIDKDNLNVEMQIRNFKNVVTATRQITNPETHSKHNLIQNFDQLDRIGQSSDFVARERGNQKNIQKMARYGSKEIDTFQLNIDSSRRNSLDEQFREGQPDSGNKQLAIGKRESFVKIEIGSSAQDCVNNQRSSSMVKFQQICKRNFAENDRASVLPELADVTKVSTPELCSSKNQIPSGIHQDTYEQQRVTSLSQAIVMMPKNDATSQNQKHNGSAVANTRSLQRHVMNDTFSEDAWKKLNTMKLQRQKQQQLKQNLKQKITLPNDSDNLNLVNERKMVGKSITDVQTSQFSQYQNSNDLNIVEQIESDRQDQSSKFNSNCFSSLAREQIALKNSKQIQSESEMVLNDRQLKQLQPNQCSPNRIISEHSETTSFNNEKRMSPDRNTKIGFDLADKINSQIDVENKARKSLKQHSINARNQDPNDINHQIGGSKSHQNSIQEVSGLEPQQNSRYQSLGVAVDQENNRRRAKGIFNNIYQIREASTQLKNTNVLSNVQPSDSSVETCQIHNCKNKVAAGQIRMSSCKCDKMQQSVNSIVSTGFGDSANSGNTGTFKKSDGSSFTLMSSEFQITKTSNETDKRIEINHGSQQLQNALNNPYSKNSHDYDSKQTKQIFSKQVKSNRLGADQEQRRRQFSLNNRYTTCLHQDKSTSLRQSMQSKGSIELYNHFTMSTEGAEEPIITENLLQQKKEKLVLPTINTNRKLQIVDVLSIANTNTEYNQQFESERISRFGSESGCQIKANYDLFKQTNGIREGSKINFNSYSLEATQANKSIANGQQNNYNSNFTNTTSSIACQSISALQMIQRNSDNEQPINICEDRATYGSATVQALSHENNSGQSQSNMAIQTRNDSHGCRSLSYRQHLKSKCSVVDRQMPKHSCHASVTSARHLIENKPEIEDKGNNYGSGLRHSQQIQGQGINCISTKNATQRKNDLLLVNNTKNNEQTQQRMPMNMYGLSKRQSNLDLGKEQQTMGSSHFTMDRE